MTKTNKEQPWCFIDLHKFLGRSAIVVAALASVLLCKKCFEHKGNPSNDGVEYEYNPYEESSNNGATYEESNPYNKEKENNNALFNLFAYDQRENHIVLHNDNNNDIILANMKKCESVYVGNHKIYLDENGVYHVYTFESNDPRDPWEESYTFNLYELPNSNTASNDRSYFYDNLEYNIGNNLEIDYNIGNNLEFGDGDINPNNNSLNNINLSEKDLSDIKSAIEYLKMIKNKNWEQLTQKNTKEWIRAVQTILKEALGYNIGELDWIFGDDTKEAIEEFQTYNKLNPDGFPGPVTITELLKKWEKTHIEGFVTDFNGEFNFYNPYAKSWDAVDLP